jgi:hypothetical protein
MKDPVTAAEEGADTVHLPRPARPLRAEFRQAPVVVLDGADGLAERALSRHGLLFRHISDSASVLPDAITAGYVALAQPQLTADPSRTRSPACAATPPGCSPPALAAGQQSARSPFVTAS